MVASSDASNELGSMTSASTVRPSVAGYQLLHRLGHGGQGQVWKARHDVDGQFVALKIIRVDHQDDPIARARFEYEYQVLSGEIDHPYIVKALDHGVLPTGELWLATEYVSGRPIHEYVNALDERGLCADGGTHAPGVFPVRAVLKMFASVCEAVEAAHRHGIIHRDLKPSNILVDDQHRPRLVDFGLARPVAPREGTLYTVTGQFLGTPPYVSPEQADPRLAGDLDQLASRPPRKVAPRGSAVDVRSDIYSLGVILYELVTGLSPYGVDSPSQVTREMILAQPPVHPREVAAHVDRDLEAILLKALAKEPARRYQSVAELREDIEALLAGRPVKARGERLGYLMRAYVRRHRFAAVGLAVALLLSVLYAPVATVLYRQANAAQQRAEQNARLARETTEWVITKVDDKLKDTIGMGELRTAILRDAYDKLQALSGDVAGDGAVDANLARSLTKLSDVALAIGKLDEAEQHRRAALAIWQKLVGREPSNPAYLERLSIGQVLVGDIHKGRGEMEAAMALYKSSLAIDERLAQAHPENITYLDNLAWSNERVGWLDPAAADLRRACFAKRHEIALELVRREPDNPVRKLNLCASYILQSPVGPNTPEWRLGHIVPASEIAEELVKQDPQDGRFLQYYAISSDQLCISRVQYSRSIEDCVERLEDVDRRISAARAADPHSLLFRMLQAGNQRSRAWLAFDQGQYLVSVQLFEDAASRFEELISAAPADETFRFAAGNCAAAAAALAHSPGVPAHISSRATEVVHKLLPLLAIRDLHNLPQWTTPEFQAELAKREQTEPSPAADLPSEPRP